MNGRIEGIYSDRATGQRIDKDGKPLREEDYEALKGLYDGEIRFMDDQLSKLFDYLRQKNVFYQIPWWSLLPIMVKASENTKFWITDIHFMKSRSGFHLLMIGPKYSKRKKNFGHHSEY